VEIHDVGTTVSYESRERGWVGVDVTIHVPGTPEVHLDDIEGLGRQASFGSVLRPSRGDHEGDVDAKRSEGSLTGAMGRVPTGMVNPQDAQVTSSTEEPEL
jgi:hypothetical protein